MAALHALLIGGGLLALALVVMTYRGGVTPGRLIVIFILALITSGAYSLYETQARDADINVVSFGANTFVHLGVMSLIGSLVLRRHVGDSPRKMHAGMVVVRITLGIVFLILGVIGGFIPILQGWIFILLAVLVLFPKSKFTEKILHKAEPKVPRTVRFLRRLGIGNEDTIASE
jgi:uncharacterized protein